MSQEKIDMEKEAIRYLEKGFSIIPITGPAYTYGKDEDEKYRNSKKPLLKSWIEFQKRYPTTEEIKEWFTKWPDANIAIITGEISGVDVLDCDSKEATVKMGSLYKGTTPVAKNKKGGHLYFQHYPGMSCHNRFMPGEDFDIKADGGYVIAPPSRIYGSDASYEWVRSCFNNAFDSLDSLLFFNYIDSINKGSTSDFVNVRQIRQDSSMWEHGKRDENLFHTANCLVKGGMPEDEIFQVLRPIMNAWGEDDEKWINAKIKSAIERAKKKKRNLHQEVLDYIDSSSGVILSSEVVKFLQLSSLPEKKNLSTIFRRLEKEGIVKKFGNRNGNWEIVDSHIEVMDYKNATGSEYPIELPLNIHNLVKIYPGNIIILAGASNTGKTSFMLEVVRLNQKRHKITYMNSEMGVQELRLRLELFKDVITLDKWNFKAIERSSQFSDILDPEGFNVIDFLEVYEDFHVVGKWINEIHKKLKNGIAVVALQKKSSTKKEQFDYGRGGEFTLEKPRLYLSMDRGKIKIVKAKIWRSHEKNPNGLIRDFKIINGWKFLPDPKGEWYTEGEKRYDGFIHED